MFRIGGSAGTGITSGLDKPRTNYQVGGGADARFFIGNRMMTQPTSTPQLNRTPIPTSSTRERLLEAIGAQPNNRNLSQFLTTFGLNLLSTPPQGNIFQTAATAAKQPTEQLFAGLDAERKLQR